MKIKLENKTKIEPLDLGDLVKSAYDDTFYVVAYQYNEKVSVRQYILWSLEGDQGYNGFYNTLDELTDSLVEGEQIFRQSEYELKLVRKGE
jgi:hypothetical protein